MANSFEEYWMKKAKLLTQALIISGALNIGFLTTFIYFNLKEKKEFLSFELKPALKSKPTPSLTNSEVLCAYSNLPLQELLFRLENKELVEDGFTKRDLALACLSAFHHFNLEKAIGGMSLQKRKMYFSNFDKTETTELTVFPGLTDFHFQAVLNYARTEKWPFTSQGLFYELKRSLVPYDPSLLEAFYLTKQFHTLFTVFQKSGLLVDKQKLIELLLEGEWDFLQEFTDRQSLIQDFSSDARRFFLVSSLIHNKSKVAANLLFDFDGDFLLKRLGDAQLHILLDLLADRKQDLQRFAKELLISPRTDEMRQKAARLLYDIANEPFLEPFDYLAAITRFYPESLNTKVLQVENKDTIEQKTPSVASLQLTVQEKQAESILKPSLIKKEHIIEKGDCLWKLSRKYSVSIEEIMKANHLESEKLKIGKKLLIPESRRDQGT